MYLGKEGAALLILRHFLTSPHITTHRDTGPVHSHVSLSVIITVNIVVLLPSIIVMLSVLLSPGAQLLSTLITGEQLFVGIIPVAVNKNRRYMHSCLRQVQQHTLCVETWQHCMLHVLTCMENNKCPAPHSTKTPPIIQHNNFRVLLVAMHYCVISALVLEKSDL